MTLYREGVLSTYREVLRVPGAVAFSAAGFLARMPMAIVGLGILLFVSGVTGSYGVAGIMSAAFSLTSAGCMILTSRWVDRFGQHRVLGWLIAVEGLFLVLFVVSMEQGWPLWLSTVLVGFAGASTPAIGPAVRARWTFVIARAESAQSPLLRSAFALESIVEEVIFTLGPLITAFLALSWMLPAPIFLAIVVGFAGTFLLIRLRKTEPPPAPTKGQGERHRSAILLPGMASAILCAIGAGSIFGSFEVATVALTAALGHPESSGLLLAMWAISSMFGGIWFGSRHFHAPLARQLVLVTAILSLTLLLAPIMASLPAMIALTLVSGALVAPLLITIFTLAERLVPNVRLTEGLTLMNSGLTIGFSFGVSASGYLIDAHSPSWGYGITLMSAVVALLVALASQSKLRRFALSYGPSAQATALNIDPMPGPNFGSTDK